MFLRRGSAPHRTRLYDRAEGSIIKLNESGSLVEFYIAKHDYEPELNGSGRTLMVRKDCYDERAFNSSNNAFSGSSMDIWLNNTWLNLLDTDIRAAIDETTFYYTPGDGDYTVTTLQRAVFLLSVTELGKSNSRANIEGTALPIANSLQIAYLNGSAVNQWTRTPYTRSTVVFFLRSDGNPNGKAAKNTYGSRPAFTLPSDFLVTDDMLA